MKLMSIILFIIMMFVYVGAFSSVNTELRFGFYDESCPNAEKIISNFVKEHIPNAPSLSGPLLRMHFHDCFVMGCDGSVLINSTTTNQAEKSAIPNLTLRGFDFIDRVKSLLENECPGVVSCSDIISLVARDAVGVIGGPYWRVPTGRRDGLLSNASEALSNIPAPSLNFSSLMTIFASKGLSIRDLVLLSGAHTIGVAHCSSFSNRLYNFTSEGDEDPSLDRDYAVNLKMFKCKNPNDDTTIVEMDPGSFTTFDLGYYKNLLKRRGLFLSDTALTTNSTAASVVLNVVSSPAEKFFEEFALSMEKMGRISVKTGSEGEIRKNCAAVNG